MDMGSKNYEAGIDRCCIERDICRDMCGITEDVCNDAFVECYEKHCAGDLLCEQASEGFVFQDDERSNCEHYEARQKPACECVEDAAAKEKIESHVMQFFQRFKRKALNKKGEIKDAAEFWLKWEGQTKEMFRSMYSKAKNEAVKVSRKKVLANLDPRRDKKPAADDVHPEL
jgi:hypothetical protein